MNYFVDDFGTVVQTCNTVNITCLYVSLCILQTFYFAFIQNDNPPTLASIGSQLSNNFTLNSSNFANHKFENFLI